MPVVPGGSSDVSTVVDRVFREYLHAPDEQPIKVPLTAAVADGATTWPIDLTTLTTEERDLLAVGVIVEAGQDQRYITAVDIITGDLTVTAAAVNGTDTAAHDEGDYVTLNPSFSRREVYDAVADEIVRLAPDLWHNATYDLTTAHSWVEVPADVLHVVKFWYPLGSTRWTSVHSVELLTDFPASATGKAVQFFGVPPGADGYLVYRASFARPDGESTNLGDLGVEAEWEPIVVVGAAAAVMAGHDIDRSSAEWVSRQLEAQNVPVGSGERIRDALLRYRRYLTEQAVRGLGAQAPTPVIRSPLGVW